MDLLGPEIKARRDRTNVTVLRKEEDWTDTAVRIITHQACTVVAQHPDHPTILLLLPAIEESKIQTLRMITFIGDFEYENVEGMDNPKLPFKHPGL